MFNKKIVNPLIFGIGGMAAGAGIGAVIALLTREKPSRLQKLTVSTVGRVESFFRSLPGILCRS